HGGNHPFISQSLRVLLNLVQRRYEIVQRSDARVVTHRLQHTDWFVLKLAGYEFIRAGAGLDLDEGLQPQARIERKADERLGIEDHLLPAIDKVRQRRIAEERLEDQVVSIGLGLQIKTVGDFEMLNLDRTDREK